MTRLELLHLVTGRAHTNGFDFRRWYTRHLGLPWISPDAALTLLDTQRRYYALIFSHDFAQSFWKPGADISFDVPPQTFARVMPDGSTRTITRKPFIRRSARPNAWKYHLRGMASAEEPLRYLRKYLHIEEDLSADVETSPAPTRKVSETEVSSGARPRNTPKRPPRPMPTDPPAFLQRPYRPR